MKHDEFKEMYRNVWSEKFIYLCVDLTRNKEEGTLRVFNRTEIYTMNAFLKVKLFSFLNVEFK